MRPFSICSRRVCCCFLLKYWISSRYSRIPFGAARVSTSPTSALMSAVEAVVAFILCKVRLVVRAITDATVVLPTPEGP